MAPNLSKHNHLSPPVTCVLLVWHRGIAGLTFSMSDQGACALYAATGVQPGSQAASVAGSGGPAAASLAGLLPGCGRGPLTLRYRQYRHCWWLPQPEHLLSPVCSVYEGWYCASRQCRKYAAATGGGNQGDTCCLQFHAVPSVESCNALLCARQ